MSSNLVSMRRRIDRSDSDADATRVDSEWNAETMSSRTIEAGGVATHTRVLMTATARVQKAESDPIHFARGLALLATYLSRDLILWDLFSPDVSV